MEIYDHPINYRESAFVMSSIVNRMRCGDEVDDDLTEYFNSEFGVSSLTYIDNQNHLQYRIALREDTITHNIRDMIVDVEDNRFNAINCTKRPIRTLKYAY